MAGPLEHAAQGIKTRTMTWAIPGSLAGIPVVSDLAKRREPVARPPFQLCETLLTILGLPSLVIFAADNEHIALLVARVSHVMIRHRPDFLVLGVCAVEQ